MPNIILLKRFKWLLCGCIAAIGMWSVASRSEELPERPGPHDSCEYKKNQRDDCVWLSPYERKEKYEILMHEAHRRLEVVLQDTRIKDDAAASSYYENVVSYLNYAQKSWEKYNNDECFLAGALAYGANNAAFSCEVDGIQQRFRQLHQSLVCLEAKSIKDRFEATPICLASLMPLISGDDRRF